MADSTREAALKALRAALEGIGPEVTVRRNPATDEGAPPLIVIRDGDPGEAEYYIGAARPYGYEHEVPLTVVVKGADDAARTTALDALLQQIGAALEADPTLGGAVEHAEAGEPDTDVEPVDGGKALAAALVPVTLSYTTTSPLG